MNSYHTKTVTAFKQTETYCFKHNVLKVPKAYTIENFFTKNRICPICDNTLMRQVIFEKYTCKYMSFTNPCAEIYLNV